jgi:tetratricopeptide (TPR) repeat protein
MRPDTLARFVLLALLPVTIPPDAHAVEPPRADLEATLHANRVAVSIMLRRLSEARAQASLIYLELDRPAEAEAEAREALRLVPDYVPAYSALASALASAFETMSRLRPDDPEVLSPYIVSLINAGDLGEARRRTEAARRLFPHLAWFDFCLARIEAREGHRREALDLLEGCARREPATGEWLRAIDDFKVFRGDPRFESLGR